MAGNLYQQETGPTASSGLGGLLLPLGAEVGHAWTTRTLIGGKRAKRYANRYGKIEAWWRRGKRANREAGAIWKGFLKPNSAFASGIMGRVEAAQHVAAGQTYSNMQLQKSFFRRGQRFSAFDKVSKGFNRSKVGGMVKRAITKRTIAGLARIPLGVANSYFWIGSLLPDIAEAGMAGLGSMAKFGAKLRSGTPETSTRMVDMATKERAFTMRQASEMALHMSQMGSRSALGSEASYLHG